MVQKINSQRSLRRERDCKVHFRLGENKGLASIKVCGYPELKRIYPRVEWVSGRGRWGEIFYPNKKIKNPPLIFGGWFYLKAIEGIEKNLLTSIIINEKHIRNRKNKSYIKPFSEKWVVGIYFPKGKNTFKDKFDEKLADLIGPRPNIDIDPYFPWGIIIPRLLYRPDIRKEKGLIFLSPQKNYLNAKKQI